MARSDCHRWHETIVLPRTGPGRQPLEPIRPARSDKRTRGGNMTTRTGPDQETMTGSTSTTGETTSLTDAASNVAGEAGKTVEQTAAQGMTQVSEVLHQVADAARQASEGLQQQQPQIGRFIMTGADKLDEAASYVAEHRPAELMDGAQSFARSQPAVVIGGA